MRGHRNLLGGGAGVDLAAGFRVRGVPLLDANPVPLAQVIARRGGRTCPGGHALDGRKGGTKPARRYQLTSRAVAQIS